MISRFHPSPALVVACIALVVALGGTSYAVTQLPANSVGTKQLKNNAVISSKVKDNSITGADVKESTLGLIPNSANALKLGGKLPSAFLASNGKAIDSAHADSADSAADSAQLGGVAANQYMKLGGTTELDLNPIAMVAGDADLSLSRGAGKVTVSSSTTGAHKVWLPVVLPDRGGTVVVNLFSCYKVSNAGTTITPTKLLQGNSSGTSQTALINDSTTEGATSATCYTSSPATQTSLGGGPIYAEYTINFNSTSHTVDLYRASLLYSDSN